MNATVHQLTERGNGKSIRSGKSGARRQKLYKAHELLKSADVLTPDTYPIKVDKEHLGSLVLLKAKNGDSYAIVTTNGALRDEQRVLTNYKARFGSGQNKVHILRVAPKELKTLLKLSGYGEELVVVSEDELYSRFKRDVEGALRSGASDIHYEVREHTTKLLYRVHGRLETVMEMTPDMAIMMHRSVYNRIARDKDIQFSPHRAQAGNLDLDDVNAGEGPLRVRLRLQTVPAFTQNPDRPCYDAIMRVLPMGVESSRVNRLDLGYHPMQNEAMEEAIFASGGSIIISGITGSGKSTTLRSMIQEIADRTGGTRKIITVEDPVEYLIQGVTQHSIVRSSEDIAKAGKTEENPFLTAIAAAMRADPDYLMIGEVRDEPSASLYVTAQLTGHKTLTTLHTQGTIKSLLRLSKLGVTDDILTDDKFIACILYQTLVATPCPACSIPHGEYARMHPEHDTVKRVESLFRHSASAADERDEGLRRSFESLGLEWNPAVLLKELPNRVRYINDDPGDCPECQGRGRIGRSVVAEVFRPSKRVYTYMQPSTLHKARQLWLEEGGITIMDHAIYKMWNGHADPRDIEEQISALTLENLT